MGSGGQIWSNGPIWVDGPDRVRPDSAGSSLASPNGLGRFGASCFLLELEAVARSAFQEENECSPEPNVAGHGTVLSNDVSPSSNTSHVGGCSSITSDYGCDTAYETSELGSPRLGRADSSDIGFGDLTLDEDLSGSIENFVKYGMSNIDEGLVMGQTILEQLEDFPRHKAHNRNINNTMEKEIYNGNDSRASFLGSNGLELFSEPEPAKMAGHAQKLSTESVGSDITSLRGNDMGSSRFPNSSAGLLGTSEVSSTMGSLGKLELQFSDATQILFPLDHRQKMNRVLLTMQQRLVTANVGVWFGSSILGNEDERNEGKIPSNGLMSSEFLITLHLLNDRSDSRQWLVCSGDRLYFR
ncbi:hypothetical protein GQ457_09G013550 [Hibiscus cannabinus]